MFKVQKLNFAYGSRKILDDINIDIQRGSFTTIIGPNGAGKTTFLNLLTGNFENYDGKILFADKPLKGYSLEERARKIAIISQDATISFPFNCLEIVMMGRNPFKNRLTRLGKKDMNIVYTCMEATDTLGLAESLITEVSGGERQRVMFARALAQTPDVLFLDEAFSNMDVYYSIKLANLLKESVNQQGITVISIMHDLNMANAFSDSIIALRQGSLIKWGETEDVIKPAFIHSLFKVNIVKMGNEGLAIQPYL